VTVVSISLTGGCTFSGPVTCPSNNDEEALTSAATSAVGSFITASGLVVWDTSAFGWDGGFPALGDSWSFDPPCSILTADSPATGFAASSGVILA
jgi:hypothetical protein